MSLRRKFPLVPVGLLKVSSCEHHRLLPRTLVDVQIESRKRKTKSVCFVQKVHACWELNLGRWFIRRLLLSVFVCLLVFWSLARKKAFNERQQTIQSRVALTYKAQTAHIITSKFLFCLQHHTQWGLWLCFIVRFLAPVLSLVIAPVFPVQSSGQLLRAPSKSPDLMPREFRTSEIN